MQIIYALIDVNLVICVFLLSNGHPHRISFCLCTCITLYYVHTLQLSGTSQTVIIAIAAFLSLANREAEWHAGRHAEWHAGRHADQGDVDAYHEAMQTLV